jgi:hypothetical protein
MAWAGHVARMKDFSRDTQKKRDNLEDHDLDGRIFFLVWSLEKYYLGMLFTHL